MHTNRSYLSLLSALFISLAWCLVAQAETPASPALQAAKGAEIDPLDWPHWRGPEWNGISREKGLVSKWSPSGENVQWPSQGKTSWPITR